MNIFILKQERIFVESVKLIPLHLSSSIVRTTKHSFLTFPFSYTIFSCPNF